MVFFQDIHVFLQLAEQAYLEQREPISSLNNLSSRKYSFHKLTQFSQGKNVLGAYASNTDGFLSRDTSVSSKQLNRPVWTKRAYLQLEKPK
jgi:hypothetical protein